MKMMSPNTTIWWIPLAGLVDPAEPTVAEINLGINLSAAIVTGYTLGATDSETDDSKTIVDEGNVTTYTFDNYEGSLSFFRSDLVAVTPVFNTAYELFKVPRAEGYLVQRLGKKATAPIAVGDEVSVFRFIADSPTDDEGDGGAPIQFTVPFLPQGNMHLNVEVTA